MEFSYAGIATSIIENDIVHSKSLFLMYRQNINKIYFNSNHSQHNNLKQTLSIKHITKDIAS